MLKDSVPNYNIIDNNDYNNLTSSYSCRICLEDGIRKDFIAPCNCNGTSKWVHRACLDKWRSIKEDTAFYSCTECLQPYKLINLELSTKEKIYKQRKRMCMFILLLCRDLLIVFVFVNVCICMLAFIVYQLDHSSKALIQLTHLQSLHYWFYYICGILLMLAIIGLGYLCIYYKICMNERGNCCIQCYDCGVSDTYCFYHPCIYSSSTGIDGTTATGLTCPLDTCCSGGSSSTCCCTESTTGMIHTESCCCCNSCTECTACSGGLDGAGEVCLILGVALFVVLICLGIFVCIAAGVVYIQKLVRYHAKVLHKYTLTKDVMVEDLDTSTGAESLTTYIELNNSNKTSSTFSWNSHRKDYQALQQSCNNDNTNNNSNNIIISENINRSLTDIETANNDNEFEMKNMQININNRIERRKL